MKNTSHNNQTSPAAGGLYLDIDLLSDNTNSEPLWNGSEQPVCKAVPLSDCAVDGGILTGYRGKAKRIALPEGITALGMDCCFGSQLEAVAIPEGVTAIGNGAFWNCFALRWVTLPDSLRVIEGNAFWNTALGTVIVPEGVEVIGGDAFTGCKKLRDVYLPASLCTIGIHAFHGLRERGGRIHAPVGSYAEVYARENGIPVDHALPDSSEDVPSTNTVFGLEDSTLVAYNGRENAVDVPETVTVIGTGAFVGCDTVETVVLPHTVERIERGAFRDCPRLYRVIIPETVTDIAEGAFEDCPMLVIDTMAGSCAAAYGDERRIPVVTDGRYALRPAVRERAEQARRMAAAAEAERARRQEEERRIREAEEAERKRREEAERLRKEAEEAERRRKEAEVRRRKAEEEAEQRRKDDERRVHEMAQSKPAEDSAARQRAELVLQRNRYDDLCSSINVQNQIIAANSGLFGQQARNRKEAQKKLEALTAKRRREFPNGRP